MTIASVGVDHYRIPLPVVLSDSTHGDIAEFELVTVRIRDAAGTEGLGYTYTVGRGGAAVAALIKHDLCPVLLDTEADRIEALWQRMWWAIHYGGRGGFASLAISAVDIALWDLKARRFGTPLWRLLGGHDPRVPAYAASRAAIQNCCRCPVQQNSCRPGIKRMGSIGGSRWASDRLLVSS